MRLCLPGALGQAGGAKLTEEATATSRPESPAAPPPALIARYADLAVRVGCNVRPGQTLVIRSLVATAGFARAAAAAAYAAGAADVLVDWDDEQISLLRHRLAPEAALGTFPAWYAQGLEGLAAEGAAFLSIAAGDPDLLSGVDPRRIALANRARRGALAGWFRHITGWTTPWCIVAVPTAGWAVKVFPGEEAPAAEARLWPLILQAMRLDGPEPVQAWRAHLDALAARAAHMNRAAFRALHYRGPGTDLRVGLPAGHRWVSPPMEDPRGIPFVPNMPTEEIFTLPDRSDVEGTVAASLPLAYRGALIQDLRLRFAGGEVVEASARSGGELLQGLLDTDPGARRLGEVALVPCGSAVARLHTLFYHTLLDENAACHLALGRAYPMCLEGGEHLDEEALLRRGANSSLEHVDFMIGSEALDVDGLTAQGTVVPLLRQGRWAFAV